MIGLVSTRDVVKLANVNHILATNMSSYECTRIVTWSVGWKVSKGWLTRHAFDACSCGRQLHFRKDRNFCYSCMRRTQLFWLSLNVVWRDVGVKRRRRRHHHHPLDWRRSLIFRNVAVASERLDVPSKIWIVCTDPIYLLDVKIYCLCYNKITGNQCDQTVRLFFNIGPSTTRKNLANSKYFYQIMIKILQNN